MSLTSILELDQEVLLRLDSLDLLNASKISKYYYYTVCTELFYQSKLRPWFEIHVKTTNTLHKSNYFIAVKKSDSDLLIWALNNCAIPLVRKLLNTTVEIKEETILAAAKCEYVKIFKQLWSLWITDINVYIEAHKFEPLFGATGALAIAASNNKIHTVKYILSLNEVHNFTSNWTNAKKIYTSLHQALNIASRNGNFEIVELLLPYSRDSRNYRQPFLYASANGHVEIMKLLVNHGLNINIVDYTWAASAKIFEAALLCSAANGKAKAVEFLLENRTIDCNITLALDSAINNEHWEVVEILNSTWN